MSNREIMLSALKEHTLPLLFAKGFTGKYPDFRRDLGHCIELVSFQANKYGGSFTVEVSAVFPNSENKNYALCDDVTEESFGVEATNKRYRLSGMYDGWFYYRDVCCKRTLFFGKHYYDVPEKEAANFSLPRGYRFVQKFNENTAVHICSEVNRQMENAYQWLENFVRKRSK